MSGSQPDVEPGGRTHGRLHLVPPVPPSLTLVDLDDMHAWIDGELPAREAASIGRRLSLQPQAAAHALAYKAQVDGLHALYDPVLEEPIPPRLLAVLAERQVRAPDAALPTKRSRIGKVALAWIAMTAIALTGGLTYAFSDRAAMGWVAKAISADAPDP